MSFSISSRELVNRTLGPDDVLAEVAKREISWVMGFDKESES